MGIAEKIRSHSFRLRHQVGTPLRIGGRRYRMRGYFANGIQSDVFQHEPHLAKSLRRALDAREGPFIDVGVNIGQTLLKVLAHDPDRRYVGFEPQIDCAFFVDNFIRDNALMNFQVLPIALADTDRVLNLFIQRNIDEGASIQRGKIHHGVQRVLSIQSRRGDDILTELNVGSPAIIKIDVEGAELQVLKGLHRTLRRCAPILFFEINPNFIKVDGQFHFLPEDVQSENRSAASEIFSFLESLGYQLNYIRDDGEEVACTVINLDDIDKFVSVDYVAYPKSDTVNKTNR